MELFHVKSKLFDEYVVADCETELFNVASHYLGDFVITNIIGKNYNIHPISFERFVQYCRQVKSSQMERYVKGQITMDQLIDLIGKLSVEDHILLEDINTNYMLCLIDL